MSQPDDIPRSVSDAISSINAMTSEERALVVLHLFPVVLGRRDLIDLCIHWIHAAGEIERTAELLTALPTYTEEEADSALGRTGLRADPARIVADFGGLIRLGVQGESYYPAFQFGSNGTVPVVRFANRRLRAGTDPVCAAAWWINPTCLGGRPPIELLELGLLDRYTAEWLIGPEDAHEGAGGEPARERLDGLVFGFAG